jgi:hypothetical protein
MLEIEEGIEHFGDPEFKLDLLKVMSDHFAGDFEAAMNGYPPNDTGNEI